MTQPVAERLVYTRSADSVVTALTSSLQQGLTDAEAEQRLDRYGPNVLPRAPTPTAWRIAVRQWAEPMNVMLTVVALVSALIAQEETALLVGFLVLLNVVLGSRQELKAQASVAALSSMQVPTARVLRSGATLEIPAENLLLQEGEHLFDHMAELFSRISFRTALFHDLIADGEHIIDDASKNVFLGLEIIVDQTFRNACCPGDIGHAGAVEGLFAEQLHRRQDDLFPAFFPDLLVLYGCSR